MNTLEPKMQDVINYRFRQGILSAVSITEKPTICTHLNIQKRHRYCILLLGQYHRAQWYAYYKHWLRASGVYHGIGSTSKSGCHYFVQSTLTWQKESYVSEYNKKCSLPGSNWRPSDYETDALPTEPKELLWYIQLPQCIHRLMTETLSLSPSKPDLLATTTTWLCASLPPLLPPHLSLIHQLSSHAQMNGTFLPTLMDAT